MPITISAVSGDGINNAALRMNVNLPDGGSNTPNVSIQGLYQPASLQASPPISQQAVSTFNGTVTSPGFNATWTTWWIAEYNPSSGSYKAVTSTSGMPTPDPSNIVLFSQAFGTASAATVTMTIQPAFTIPSLVNVSPN